MRKQAMIWNLNCFASRQYITDKIFRNSLETLMWNPNKQLQLEFRGLEKTVYGPFGPFEHTLGLNTISVIPSLNNLHSIVLKDCYQVDHIGDCKSLRVLKLICCENLHSVGMLDNLTDLSINRVPEELFRYFRWENIHKLVLEESFLTSFCENLHRFRGLLELTLCSIQRRMDLPPLPFPLLEKLSVLHFNSADLTGLISLKSLYLLNVPTEAIFGKHLIYPQLHSLTSDSDPFIDENIQSFTHLIAFHYSIRTQQTEIQKFSNFPQVSLRSPQCLIDKITVGVKVCSLEIKQIHVKSIELLPRSKLVELFLSSRRLSDISGFSHLSRLELSLLPIRDISPVKAVPYLIISLCREIQNFACLGSQKFLLIDQCETFDNSALEKFGHIFSLTVRNCSRITKISNLTFNRYLQFRGCFNLEEIFLEGNDYLKVVIAIGSNLKKLKITGRIYSFTLGEVMRKDVRLYEYVK
jgi:hypothetical protein